MNIDEECRKEFEAMCRFMGVEFSLEWDKAGFYQQLETDRCYTWFKLGFGKTKTSQIEPDESAFLMQDSSESGLGITSAKGKRMELTQTNAVISEQSL